MKCWYLSLLVLALVVQQHMMSPVSSDNGEDHESYDEVKELESLRNENNRRNNTEQISQPELAADKATASSKAGETEPQSNSRSAIFRHRGITQAKKNKYWNEKNQQNEGYSKYSGIQFSPSDLAAYIFSTGDEEGVAVAVEELVREGLMGRTDAINYLQDVKQVLAYMKDQFEQQKKLQEMRNRAYPKPQITQRLPNPPREQFVSPMAAEKREPKEPELPAPPAVTTEHPHQVVIASTSEPKGLTHSASTTIRPKTDSSLTESLNEDDFKRRVKEKSVENSVEFTLQVIYKLAKDMFSQSILKDDPAAEDTLSGLVAFLESEVGNKRISPEMKERVLEIVSTALVDSLREYQRMMPENQLPAFDEASFYRHLTEANGAAAQKNRMPEGYRKLPSGGPVALPLTSKSNRPKSS